MAQNNSGELTKLYDKVEKETAYRLIPTQFELVVREKMSNYFGIQLLEKQVKNVPKKFDMVSPDGSIIGEAKFYRKTKGGESGKYSIFAEYVWLLEKTSAKTKFIVFGGAREIIEKWIAKHKHLFEKNLSFFFYDMETDRLEKLE